jgi:peptide deformylase
MTAPAGTPTLARILLHPHPTLRTPALPFLFEADVPAFRAALDILFEQLAVTMPAAKGIGLAAPQIDVPLQVALIDLSGQTIELINPKVLGSSGKIRHLEACLSLPGCSAHVERATRVVVETRTRAGDTSELHLEGMAAIAAQHEIDHLGGITITERCGAMERDVIRRRMAAARKSVGESWLPRTA